jgi:hypothetical protein
MTVVRAPRAPPHRGFRRPLRWVTPRTVARSGTGGMRRSWLLPRARRKGNVGGAPGAEVRRDVNVKWHARLSVSIKFDIDQSRTY